MGQTREHQHALYLTVLAPVQDQLLQLLAAPALYPVLVVMEWGHVTGKLLPEKQHSLGPVVAAAIPAVAAAAAAAAAKSQHLKALFLCPSYPLAFLVS